MAFFSKASTSHYLSSSDSENEITGNLELNINKISINKNSLRSRTSIASSLSRQTSNNSLKYFKKMKRKNIQSQNQFQNNDSSSSSPDSLKILKTKHNLNNSKNISINKKFNNYMDLKTTCPKSIKVNKEFAYAIESSSDSDFPDLKYLKFVSKNKELNTSSASRDSRQSKSSSKSINKKHNRIKNVIDKDENIIYHQESSSSSLSNYPDYIKFENRDYNHDLNLDNLSDCSLSDLLLIRKDDGDRNSQLYKSPQKTDDSFIRMKSLSPKPIPLNISLGIDDKQLPQKPSDVIINIPNLITNDIEDEKIQLVNDIEISRPEFILNKKHSKNDVLLTNSKVVYSSNKSEPMSNNSKSIQCITSEPVCSNCNENLKKNTKRIKSKLSHKQSLTNNSDVLRIKKSHRPYNMRKIKKYNNSMNTTEDIGLEYDTCKDNYMVELPNGILVPSFLSTIKPKYVKKICACGITAEEIPISWSESFHDILHQNIYKLHFKSIIPANDTINIKQNDLFYRIVSLNDDHYNDTKIKKSVKDVEDFVNIEYGISKTAIQSYYNLIFLAVLPNFKVIGYLEVKPISNANIFTNGEQILEKSVPVKFGISKIWVLIKYRNKNVDVNLLESFRNKKKLQKKDLAFFLDGCPNIKFIQEYIENKNILIYNEL